MDLFDRNTDSTVDYRDPNFRQLASQAMVDGVATESEAPASPEIPGDGNTESPASGVAPSNPIPSNPMQRQHYLLSTPVTAEDFAAATSDGGPAASQESDVSESGSAADESKFSPERFWPSLGQNREQPAANSEGSSGGQAMPRVQLIVSLANSKALFDEMLPKAIQEASQRFHKITVMEIEQAAWIRKCEERAADYRLRGGW